jgi:hypothetical protein
VSGLILGKTRTVAPLPSADHDLFFFFAASLLMLDLIFYTGFALPVSSMLGWISWIRWLNPIQ